MVENSRGLTVIGANSALLALLILFVGMRVWVRFGILRHFDWDDAFVLASTAFAITVMSCMMVSTKYGLGLRRSQISDEDFDTYAKLNTTVSCSYILGFILAKMSFAYLYIKVLPDLFYQRLNKFMLCFLVAQCIEEVCVVLFECKPIQKLWTPSLAGHCLDLTYFFYAVFAIKMITDLILFIEPIPTMWKLQLPLAKRVGLIAMLSIGLFVCVISIIRVTYIGYDKTDATSTGVDAQIWSSVEITALLICSCIPSLRPAVKKFPVLNRALGLSSDHSSNPYYTGKQTGSGGRSIALQSRHNKDQYIQSQRTNTQSRVRSNHFGITSTAAPKVLSSSAASTDEIFPHDVDKHGGIMVTRDIQMGVEERRENEVAEDSTSQLSDDSVSRPQQAKLSGKSGGNMSWLAGN